jgi:hypothetical protein
MKGYIPTGILKTARSGKYLDFDGGKGRATQIGLGGEEVIMMCVEEVNDPLGIGAVKSDQEGSVPLVWRPPPSSFRAAKWRSRASRLKGMP